MWSKRKEGAHTSASLYLWRGTPAFWPIFPYSWKLLIWLTSIPLAPSDSRFSLTLVKMTFQSSAPWLSLGPLLACFILLGRARASSFQLPNQHPQITMFEKLMTNCPAAHPSLPPKAHCSSSTPAVSFGMGSAPAPHLLLSTQFCRMAYITAHSYKV